MPHYLELKNIQFSHGELEVLQGVSLNVSRGTSVSLMGKSGNGKTTLLRLIAGLEKMQSGTISLAGNMIASPKINMPPQEREIGFVFQFPTLFPHLTVEKNIGFGVKNISKEAWRERVFSYAKKVGIDDHFSAYPHELSGGQQQRVALARALICSPKLMLLDEPFSSLDMASRVALREEVKRILNDEKMTSILVTHDAEEAVSFSDNCHELREGKIAQRT